MQLLQKIRFLEKRLMIKMLQQNIFQFADSVYLLLEDLLVKELADLESDLGILVGKEGCNPGLR